MPIRKKKLKLFVDGEVLSIAHFSGIGHYTADLMYAIDKLIGTNEYSHVTVEVGVPMTGMPFFERFDFKHLKTKRIYAPPRVTNKLKSIRRLPPIDFLFGKKIYLFPNYSSWPTAFSKNVPFIYDLSFIHYPEFASPPNLRFLVQQVELSVKRADVVLTISENSSREICEYYGVNPEKVHIAYPAVNRKNFYKRSSKEIELAKAKHGVFGKYILFVGNLEPRKNLVSLLEAYDKLPKKVQEEFSLLLVGAKGWLDSDIHDKIISMRMKGLRVIQPSGYVSDEDLPAIYSGASLFVYVSLYEGFGIPPLEAMACEAPVIASNNSSLPEAVGGGALMVEATDTEALTHKIRDVLGDQKLSDRLVTEGTKQVTRFSWDKTARDFLDRLSGL
jgi:glycosyltransferase involved in cell wall biosynthesis